jgi:hypothetical protein
MKQSPIRFVMLAAGMAFGACWLASGCDSQGETGQQAAMTVDQEKQAQEMLQGYSKKYNQMYREKKAAGRRK